MKTVYIFSVVFLLLNADGYSQKSPSRQKAIPNGRWINVQDSLYEIIVNGKYIYSLYNGVANDTAQYYFSSKPCDSLFKPSKNAVFLNWGGLCYQVDGLTDEYMGLFYVFGRTITFWKEHNK